MQNIGAFCPIVARVATLLLIAPLAADGFTPAQIDVPDGFSVELAAGPPLVQHPMFATFDDRGRLFVCENAGVNMTAEELEAQVPNSIRLLEDGDGDGRFDRSTVFADKMTYPMGGAWHDGALYVASPPYIWRLADSDGDGVADQRDILVSKFGSIGNAADIHGCVSGPDGRLYWCDGYHGHEFRDAAGNITSKREGSYLFSCRPDGSDVRLHCGGGMDNPVEVDFTEEGEMLGTVNLLYNRPRVDCFVHWLYGGVYPHREQILAETKTTGELLGPVHRFGHVAAAGTLRYRSGALDRGWRDDFFATFFNSGKVVRLELEREGATFHVTQREFLSCASRDFHPTDVAEDADGSLLVLDTGGWFYRGCPTSQYPKPDILGAVYRVRRSGTAPPADPWGQQTDWTQQTDEQLGSLLSDARFKVRERAIAECAKRGDAIVPTLREAIERPDPLGQLGAVRALAGIVGRLFDPSKKQGNSASDGLESQSAEPARAAIRFALSHSHLGVRLAACHCLAMYPDGRALDQLIEMVRQDEAAGRRAAATALGRLGDHRAVPAVLAALAGPAGGTRPTLDRAEDHALIYALIEINDPAATRAGLTAHDADTQRGALIAIDQMDGGDLTAEDVLPLVDARDEPLQRAAANVFSRRTGWSNQAAVVLTSLLARPELIESNSAAIHRLMKTFLTEPAVGDLVGRMLQEPQTPRATRDLLLAAIAEGRDIPLHASWVEPLERLLDADDPETIELTVAALAAIKTDRFHDRLQRLGADEQLPTLLRVAAWEVASGQRGTLTDAALDLLIELLTAGGPSDSVRAAQKIGTSALSTPQLIRLAPLLSSASPSQLHELLGPFEQSDDVDVAKAFLAAMENARGLTSLTPPEFSDVVLGYPPELLPAANVLLDRVRQEEQQKLVRLDKLLPLLDQGNAARGRELFFAEKSKCATCHTVGNQGGKIGPDLTTIGANRAAHDLLESIVFPSATMVRDYEPYILVTADGRVLSGLIARETSDTVYVQQQTGDPVAVSRNDIEQQTTSTVSIMPNGLDEALTETELADVVAYLLSLTQPAGGQTAAGGE